MGPTTQQMGGVAAGSGGETGEMIISSGDSGAPAGGGGGLKMSRGMVLGIILAVLVLVGGGVGVVLWMNVNNTENTENAEVITSGNTGNVNVGAIRNYFNEYVNYLLSGTGSTNTVDMGFEYGEDYKVVQMLSSNKTRRAEYYAELEAKFANFMSEFDEAFPDMDTGDVISSNYNYLNYLRMHAEAGLGTDEVLEVDENGSEWSVEDYGDLQFDVMYVVGNSKNINAILVREGV